MSRAAVGVRPRISNSRLDAFRRSNSVSRSSAGGIQPERTGQREKLRPLDRYAGAPRSLGGRFAGSISY